MTTQRGQLMALSNLVGGATASHYTLPAEVLAAWHTYDKVRALTLAEPSAVHVEDAATQLVAAVREGGEPEVLELGREVHRADADRKAHGVATCVLAEAIEQASAAAVSVTADMTERTITNHLHPALDSLHDSARHYQPPARAKGTDVVRVT